MTPFSSENALRDVVRVLVGRRRLVEHPEPLGQRGLELGVHVVARGGLGVGHVVLEQVARVLGEHVDRAVLDLGDVHLALADAEVALDRVAVLLERLRVELGDDLVRVVVLRTDDDRLRRLAVARRSAAERIARRTPCQGHCRPDRDRCECNEPALSCCDHSGFPSLMGRPTAARGRAGPERSSGVLAARTPAGTTRRWVSAKHPSTTSASTITRIGSAEHLGVVAGLQPGEDEPAEPEVGDVRGERRGRDDLQRRRADAADHDRHAERELDLADDLRSRACPSARAASMVRRSTASRPAYAPASSGGMRQDDERDDGRPAARCPARARTA